MGIGRAKSTAKLPCNISNNRCVGVRPELRRAFRLIDQLKSAAPLNTAQTPGRIIPIGPEQCSSNASYRDQPPQHGVEVG